MFFAANLFVAIIQKLQISTNVTFSLAKHVNFPYIVPEGRPTSLMCHLSTTATEINLATPKSLLLGDLDLAIVDAGLDVAGGLSVDGAADGVAGAEDLLDGAGKDTGHGALAHGAGDLDDLVEGEVAVVDDVLLLLAVTDGLVEGLHDEGGGRGDHGDGSLTVDDGELDGDVQALPVLGGLLDVLTDLLGGEAERTDLGRKGGGRSDLATHGAHDHDLNVIGRRRAHGVYRR